MVQKCAKFACADTLTTIAYKIINQKYLYQLLNLAGLKEYPLYLDWFLFLLLCGLWFTVCCWAWCCWGYSGTWWRAAIRSCAAASSRRRCSWIRAGLLSCCLLCLKLTHLWATKSIYFAVNNLKTARKKAGTTDQQVP